MKHILSAGIIVQNIRNETPYFLLLQHSKGGHWSLPKGKIEPGETKRTAALRELKEETGLSKVNIDPNFETSTSYIFTDYDGQKAHKTVYFFLAKVNVPHVTLSEEHSHYCWLPVEKALKILTYDADRRMLMKAAKIC